MKEYPKQWEELLHSYQNKTLAQAMIFVSQVPSLIYSFVEKLLCLYVCKNALEAPCGTCAECRMVHELSHPDIQWIKPEKKRTSIKIEQIRDLQSIAYRTPQRSKYRIIVLEGLEYMNRASANALLKILEEPPKHLVFILLAGQLSTVLPTILSRCHKYRFPFPDTDYEDNLLTLGALYAQEADRSTLIDKAESLLEDLIALRNKQTHPCIVAAKWAEFDLPSILWFLYLVYAQLIKMSIKPIQNKGLAVEQLNTLYPLIKTMSILEQISKINLLIKKLSHNINMNQLLVLEDLMLALASSP